MYVQMWGVNIFIYSFLVIGSLNFKFLHNLSDDLGAKKGHALLDGVHMHLRYMY